MPFTISDATYKAGVGVDLAVAIGRQRRRWAVLPAGMRDEDSWSWVTARPRRTWGSILREVLTAAPDYAKGVPIAQRYSIDDASWSAAARGVDLVLSLVDGPDYRLRVTVHGTIDIGRLSTLTWRPERTWRKLFEGL